jgi:hypothetical protein
MSATATLGIEQSFLNLQVSTINILEQAFALSQKKEELNRNEYKKYLESQDWSNKEAKVYIQVANTFEKFIPEDLAEIEPNTIFTLAKQRKKYAPVIQNILETGEFGQKKVSEWMDWVNAQRPQREGDNSIWRLSRDGRRYAVLGNIWDQELGVMIQSMIDEEGITSQKLIAEAISLRQAYIEGRIILVEKQEDLENHLDYTTTSNTQNLETQNLETQNPETQNPETQNPEKLINNITFTEEHTKDICEDIQREEQVTSINIEMTSIEVSNVTTNVDNQSHIDSIIDTSEAVQEEINQQDKESNFRASTIDLDNDVSNIENIDTLSNVDNHHHPSPQEIVEILVNCTNWEEVILVTDNFSQEVKKACWQILDSHQRDRLHNLKKQYQSNLN